MIHYAGVTAYNEVQSDTPVAVDNGGSGGTGLTTFLERRVAAAVREVTRRDLREGGPASRGGTARSSRGRRSPRGPLCSPREAAPKHRHILGQRNVFPSQAAPRMCAQPPVWDAVESLPGWCPRCPGPGAAPQAPPGPRSPAGEINDRLFRAERPSCERLLVGKGGERKGSLRTPPHVLPSGRAPRRCRGGGTGGTGAGLAAGAEPRGSGLISRQAGSAVRRGLGRCD